MFANAAGFLRIAEPGEPLDDTQVHPESYHIARDLIEAVGASAGGLARRVEWAEEVVPCLRVLDLRAFAAAGGGRAKEKKGKVKKVKRAKKTKAKKEETKEKGATNVQWSCPSCTFLNDADRSACTVCGSSAAGAADASASQDATDNDPSNDDGDNNGDGDGDCAAGGVGLHALESIVNALCSPGHDPRDADLKSRPVRQRFIIYSV